MDEGTKDEGYGGDTPAPDAADTANEPTGQEEPAPTDGGESTDAPAEDAPAEGGEAGQESASEPSGE